MHLWPASGGRAGAPLRSRLLLLLVPLYFVLTSSFANGNDEENKPRTARAFAEEVDALVRERERLEELLPKRPLPGPRPGEKPPKFKEGVYLNPVFNALPLEERQPTTNGVKENSHILTRPRRTTAAGNKGSGGRERSFVPPPKVEGARSAPGGADDPQLSKIDAIDADRRIKDVLETNAINTDSGAAQQGTRKGLKPSLRETLDAEAHKRHQESQWAATKLAASIRPGLAPHAALSAARSSEGEGDHPVRSLQGTSGGGEGVNLALNKGVALSSVGTETHPNPAIGEKQGSAVFAVDGKKGMSFFQDGCAQTWSDNMAASQGQGGVEVGQAATDDFPWFRLDLGRSEHIGLVRLWLRNDVVKTMTHFEFRVGHIGGSRWDENVICSSGPGGGLSGVTEVDDDGVVLIPGQMNSITCEGFGRYLFIVIKKRSAVLALCEVEVVAKGPTGIVDQSVVAGQPFNLYLQGIGMGLTDRVRIVDDGILCGTEASRHMSANVFPLTAPTGPPDDTGAGRWEQWANVTIGRSGYYKLCWCGGNRDPGEDVFSMHAVRLVVTGSIVTIANGAGSVPTNATGLENGIAIIDAMMEKPLDVAVMDRGIFVAEGHRLRYLDLIYGEAYRIAGTTFLGNSGNGGLSAAALLNVPAGLTVHKRQYYTFLHVNAAFGTAKFQTANGDEFSNTQDFVYRIYFTEQMNHQVRMIEYNPNHMMTTAGMTEAKLYATTGIVSQVVGTGSPGFSGDGGSALLARLDSPNGIYLDAENMLWIADTLNNRIRIVYLDPLSTRFGKIYTAIGEGPQGYGGDGGNSLRGQINLPKGVVCTHVDPLEEDDEEGRLLRAVVYFSEFGNHVGRMVQMHYGETCGLQNGPICGIIDTYVGIPMQQGYMLGQLRDTAFLNSPIGLTYNTVTNMLLMADWGNHRLIGMPTAQVVSMGCWRDSSNPSDVLLMSLENPSPPSPFLVGDYLQRKNPVEACFFEALRLGYIVFGIRQNGMCVSNKNAENTYKAYKSSTTCVNGLGHTSDNNIYKIIAPGQSLSELGRVFAIANAGGQPGYAQAAVADHSIALNAISSELHSPAGIDVDSVSNNLWIADSLNNRVRVIYGQAGPNSGQQYRCTNGMRCVIEIRGNGMMTTDRIGMFPAGTSCGDPDAFFSEGFTSAAGASTNPAALIPSNMFDAKQFDLGVPVVEKAAHFQVCFCPDQSARGGGGGGGAQSQSRICKDSRYFTTGAGTLTISGPDRLRMDVRAGEAFHLLVSGVQLHIGDRVMFRNAVDPATGAAKTCMDNFLDGSGADVAQHMDDLNMFMYEIAITAPYQIPRDYGNTTVSLWQRVELKRAGVFLACWCDGQREPPEGFRSRQSSDLIPCRRRGDYQVQAAEVHVHGPYTMDGTFYAPGMMSLSYSAQVATSVQLRLEGTGFRRSDRIRLVRKLSATHKCGTLGSMSFSDTMFGRAPTGPPLITSGYSATWTDFKFKDNLEILVCFCGRSTGSMKHVSQNFPGHLDTKTHGGCTRDQDFNIFAGSLHVKGLSATQPNGGIFRVAKQTTFSLTLYGTDFTRSEKIALVESYIACGSTSAGISSAQLIGEIDNIPMRNSARTEITWSDLRVDSDTILKICYCGGNCDSGLDYMLEIGAVLVGNAASHSILPTSLVTSNPTEEELREFNRVHAFPVQFWTARANVLYGYILHVKTRDSPAQHSGSQGPFHVHFCRTETECIPQFAVLTKLESLGYTACKGTTCCGKGTLTTGTPAACKCNAGYTGAHCEVQVFQVPRVLMASTLVEFRSIRIVAGTNDAWFCESIEVFFGGDQNADDVAMYQKSNKYLVNTWFSSNPTPRTVTTGKYYFYENNWRNANQQPAFTFPFPSRPIASSYFLQSDPCNGCSLGYECIQQPIQEGELLWRDFNFKKTPDRIGTAQATCAPVCGDGWVVADEQCDDGNILADDGCSPHCTVEHSWRCVSNYDPVTGNARVALKSVCALEFCNERSGASVLTQNYGLSHFQRGHQIGYICSESAARTIVPRDDTFLRCYAWTPLLELPPGAPRDDICPATLYQENNFKLLAGKGFDTFSFRPQRYTKVDCRAFDMVERLPGRTVDTQLENQKKDAPFRTQGYRTKEECRDACFKDPDCVYSQFWIQGEAASDCALTFDCHSHCKLIVAYTVERSSTNAERLQYGPGYSYVYRKVRRAGGTQDGDYYCGIQRPPQPVSSYYTQDFGAVVILFDDAIHGVKLGQEMFCTDYVAAISDDLIGGTEAQCIWKSPQHLYLQFGGRAQIGSTEWAMTTSVTAATTLAPRARQLTTSTAATTMIPVYDYLHQVHGGPSFIVFKSSTLRPRGNDDFPVPDPVRHYGVSVRSGADVVARTPEIILRAPDSLGTCSDVEFRASESHTSGMRRWASVKWTCLETRPMDENDLMQVMRDILYAYCETHVQPLLDTKPWCGGDASNDPDIVGVRPCDLKVVIPLSVACQLTSISLRVDVVTFNGMHGRAEATASRGSRNPFLPMARAVGPRSLFLPMEVDETKPIRFEVTTRNPEYLDDCYQKCIQSSPLFTTTASASTTVSPKTAEEQAKLADLVRDFIKVKWYYGNYMIGPSGERTPPSIMELYDVDDQNESVNQNVLKISSFKMPHMFYQPNAVWYFAAAVTFSSRSTEETAFSLVPFEVTVGRVQQPDIVLRAPLVVQGTTCGFIVDASQSKYTELRAWSVEHGGGIVQSGRALSEHTRRRILSGRQIVTEKRPAGHEGFSEEEYRLVKERRGDNVPALARWLEAGGNSTTFLRELRRQYDEEYRVRFFNKNQYKKLAPPPAKRELQLSNEIATTTTTTTKTFDMASWDGLTHVDDPRFIDCFEQFPEMLDVENPRPTTQVRAVCQALNRTSAYEPCMLALVSARVQTQTLPDIYCRMAVTNCTIAISPPISEPAWCKPQPLVVDPFAVTSVGSSPPRPHQMVYRWSCRKLPSHADDEQPPQPTPDSILKEIAAKLEVCKNAYGFVPALEVPVGLKAGIYEFSVEVYDRSTKDMVFNVQKSILVQVLGVEAEDVFPVHIGGAHDGTVVTDMGRGPTCIRADVNSEKRFAMRFRGTDPREMMRNLILINAEDGQEVERLRNNGYPDLQVSVGQGSSFQKYRRDLGFTITESTTLLEYKISGYSDVLTAGFVYDFLLVGCERSDDSKMAAFYRYTNETSDRLALTAQFPDYPYRFAEESIDPDGMKKLRGVHGDTMAPAVAPGTPSLISIPTSGVAVKDMFRLDMIWATNYAPLEYGYVYAAIPSSLQQAFVDCRDFASSPVIRRNATKFLAQTLQPVMKEIREFSYRSDMQTTFAQGHYLVGGIAKDALGAQASAFACVEVTELHREDAAYSPIKRLEALDEFVRRTSAALATLRGDNQPGGEIALIYEILTKDMPNFWGYDWDTMAFENDPTVEFVQPLDAPPLVSAEQRRRAENFVRQVLSSLQLAATQLHEENLRKPNFVPPTDPGQQGAVLSNAITTTAAPDATAPPAPAANATRRELDEGAQSATPGARFMLKTGDGEEHQYVLADAKVKRVMQHSMRSKSSVSAGLDKQRGEPPSPEESKGRGPEIFSLSAEERERRRKLSGHVGNAPDHLMTHRKLNNINELYHVNTLANSVLLMSKQIGVFANSTIDLMAAEVVNTVMRRFRDGHGVLFHFDNAAEEFLEAEAILLDRTKHLMLQRNQKTVANFNFTAHAEARVSQEIVTGVVNIAETYVVGAEPGEMRSVLAPYIDTRGLGGGRVGAVLSISVSRDRPSLFTQGVNNGGVGKQLVPNANLVGRWPYPYTRMALLGEPMTDVMMNHAYATGQMCHLNFGDAVNGALAGPMTTQPPLVTDMMEAAAKAAATGGAPLLQPCAPTLTQREQSAADAPGEDASGRGAGGSGGASQETPSGMAASRLLAGESEKEAVLENDLYGAASELSPEADLRQLLVEPRRGLTTEQISATTAPPSMVGHVITDYNDRHQCWEENESFGDFVTIYSISWPKDPFHYVYGDVGIRNNVSLIYSMGLRSCGEPLLIQKKSVLEMDFRLETETVRENRYGYGDMNPYRVVWWKENLIDDGVRVTPGGDRTQMYRTERGWTDGGCRTTWSRIREEMVYAKCDHVVNQYNDGFAGGYQVWGLEILPKPAYAQPGVEFLNLSVHNNLSYWILFVTLLFFFVRKFAAHADKSAFWPSEATLSQILFLLAEQERLERLKEHERLQAIAREEAKDPFYKVLRQRKLRSVVLTEGVPAMLVSTGKFLYEFFFKVNRAQERVKRWWRRREKARAERGVEWRNCVRFRHEEMLTNEVRELRAMREKTRNRLYEHFFQQTELHPDDIHVDGQNIKIETIHDILGSAESSEYESSVEDGEQDGLPKEAPDVPKLEDVLFDNEPKNELEALLGMEDEDPDKLPELLPGWQHIVREDTGERAYRNLLTDFIAMEVPTEAAWGAMVLPAGWMLCYSQKFDRAYYFYPSSGKTQWSFPKKGDEVVLEDQEKLMTLQKMQEMRVEAMDAAPQVGPDGKPLSVIRTSAVRGSLVQNPDDRRIDPKATAILNETFKNQTLQPSSQDADLVPGPGLPAMGKELQTKKTLEALNELADMGGGNTLDASAIDLPVGSPGTEGAHKVELEQSSSAAGDEGDVLDVDASGDPGSEDAIAVEGTHERERPATSSSSSCSSSSSAPSRGEEFAGSPSTRSGAGGQQLHASPASASSSGSFPPNYAEGGSSSSSSPRFADLPPGSAASRSSRRKRATEPLPAFLRVETVEVAGVRYSSFSQAKPGARCYTREEAGGSSSSTCRTPRGKPPDPNEDWAQNGPPVPPGSPPSRKTKRRRNASNGGFSVAIEIAPSANATSLSFRQKQLVSRMGGGITSGRANGAAKNKYVTRNSGPIEGRPPCPPPSHEEEGEGRPPGNDASGPPAPAAHAHEETQHHDPALLTAVEHPIHLEGAHRKSPVQSPRNVVSNAQHAHVPGRPPAATGQTDLSLALPPPQGTQPALRNMTAASVAQYHPASANSQIVLAGQRPKGLSAPELPKNWEVHVSSDGKVYYVNVVANLTQWEIPMLPFPWQERVSRAGRVYYVNDQTGVTQWHWPDEEISGGAGEEAGSEMETEEDLERSMGATSPGGGFQLALPGQTFGSSGGTGDGQIVPYSKEIVPFEEGQDILAEGENVIVGVAKGDKEWGVDDQFNKFKNAEEKALEKKKAIARQHRTAHQVRGIRDFVRQHELGAYEQNWGKYLDSVRDKKDKLERSKKAELGKQMELDKEELRSLFPIVQRLQWTKWTPQKLYLLLFLQRNHFVRIFENYARPSKAHRENLWETRLVIAAFVCSWTMFGSHSSLSEDVAASEVPLGDLLALPFDMGFQIYFVLYLALADFISSACSNFLEDVFFHSQLELKEFQLDEEQRQAKMKHWHKISSTGDAFLSCVKAFLVFLMFVIAAVTPAPRSAAAVMIFVYFFAWLHFLRPAIHAFSVWLILFVSTKAELFDGYLSWYPVTMDFLFVSVHTAEFLAWRLHRMMKEAVIMKQVHESEYAFELWQAVLDARKAPKPKSNYRKSLENAASKYQ